MRVFKYRGGDDKVFSRDLSSLEQDYFWSPTYEDLNDPCEGLVLTDQIFDQLDALNNVLGNTKQTSLVSLDSVKEAFRDLIAIKDKAGIYSLSKIVTDELLWAHYANSHNGFCIEYDLDKLREFEGAKYSIFKVIYQNKPPIMNVDSMFATDSQDEFLQKLTSVKSKRWEYEDEIRIITPSEGKQYYDFRAVRSIYFGLRMKKKNIQLIMETLQGRGIKYFQMQLRANSYELTYQLIEDLYLTKQRYKYSISPIDEYAIDAQSLDEKWSKYKPYLFKLAEIARREPYCQEVTMVALDAARSTNDNPIFFAQFKRKEYRYQNVSLNIKEIDDAFELIDDLEESCCSTHLKA
ncbi:DUF2971 domain-containing protein [Providencia manganoxydans]|uniref:DUF2971 domain-containing protein n=1 Tax=Providencia stuartii TaxID=588 RepID=A0A1S1HQX1_PROST|nr:hypothetical protein A3Q29_17005 [Providencia stuartii]